MAAFDPIGQHFPRGRPKGKPWGVIITAPGPFPPGKTRLGRGDFPFAGRRALVFVFFCWAAAMEVAASAITDVVQSGKFFGGMERIGRLILLVGFK